MEKKLAFWFTLNIFFLRLNKPSVNLKWVSVFGIKFKKKYFPMSSSTIFVHNENDQEKGVKTDAIVEKPKTMKSSAGKTNYLDKKYPKQYMELIGSMCNRVLTWCSGVRTSLVL